MDQERGSNRRQQRVPESATVDRTALEIMGLVLGGVTAAVIVIAGLLVHNHVATRTAIERIAPVVSVSLRTER